VVTGAAGIMSGYLCVVSGDGGGVGRGGGGGGDPSAIEMCERGPMHTSPSPLPNSFSFDSSTDDLIQFVKYSLCLIS